jgi:hypothetical protein
MVRERAGKKKAESIGGGHERAGRMGREGGASEGKKNGGGGGKRRHGVLA